MKSFTSRILSYLGLIGSSLPTGSIVPKAQTPGSQDRAFRDLNDAGALANPDIWNRFDGVMQRPQTLDTQLLLWDEMSTWDLLAAAGTEIVDEVLQTDSNNPEPLWFECNDSAVEEELNEMRDRIGTSALLPSQVWNVTSLGNHFEKVEYSVGDGVQGLSFVHPLEIRRYWLARNRRCVGFRWRGHPPDKEDIFVMPDNQTPVERVAFRTNKNATEDLWYPWDFMHMRRMHRLRNSEHGSPLWDEAQGIYKKLRMAIDQMVVHRAQVQPDRYVIGIDTGEQPPTEQYMTVHRWKQSFRSQQSFGQGSSSSTLSDPTDYRSFYSPLALDTILWLAKPKNTQHSVEKLAGTATVPDVFDIELLLDLFFSIIGMPKSWFGIGQTGDGAQAPSGKSLLAQDIRFMRKAKSIRRPIIDAYTWLAYFHMILKKKDIRDLNIVAKMPDIGGLEDQMRLDLAKMQAEVLSLLAQVMEQYNLPKEAWVELIFKRYLHLPDEAIDIFLTSLPAPQPPPGAELASARIAPPAPEKLILEISNALAPHRGLINNLRKLSTDFSPPRSMLKKHSIIESLIIRPHDDVCVENNVIIGKHESSTELSRTMTRLHEGKNVEAPVKTTKHVFRDPSLKTEASINEDKSIPESQRKFLRL